MIIFSRNYLIKQLVIFLLLLGIVNQTNAETEIYKNACESIVQIPIVKVDKDECYVFEYDGYVLKISEDLTIIGLKSYGDYSFDFLFSNQFADEIRSMQSEMSVEFNLLINNEKAGIREWLKGDQILFTHIPNNIFQNLNQTLEIKLECAIEKIWYTGKITKKNWFGRKLDRPKYSGGEWKQEMIDKKEALFRINPEYIKALFDIMGCEHNK